jgi:hypothetical protein
MTRLEMIDLGLAMVLLVEIIMIVYVLCAI